MVYFIDVPAEERLKLEHQLGSFIDKVEGRLELTELDDKVVLNNNKTAVMTCERRRGELGVYYLQDFMEIPIYEKPSITQIKRTLLHEAVHLSQAGNLWDQWEVPAEKYIKVYSQIKDRLQDLRVADTLTKGRVTREGLEKIFGWAVDVYGRKDPDDLEEKIEELYGDVERLLQGYVDPSLDRQEWGELHDSYDKLLECHEERHKRLERNPKLKAYNSTTEAIANYIETTTALGGFTKGHLMEFERLVQNTSYNDLNIYAARMIYGMHTKLMEGELVDKDEVFWEFARTLTKVRDMDDIRAMSRHVNGGGHIQDYSFRPKQTNAV